MVEMSEFDNPGDPMILGLPFIDSHGGMETLTNAIWLAGLWIPRWAPRMHSPGMKSITSQGRLDGPRQQSSSVYGPHRVVSTVVDDQGLPKAPILDGDSVLLTNFRGDRAIELCMAFESDQAFDKFERKRVPNVYFAGMMEYEAESLFLHYIYKDGGARSASFPPVAAAGSSGAVLHYGHAGAANDQEIKDGDMVRTMLLHTLHFNASTE